MYSTRTWLIALRILLTTLALGVWIASPARAGIIDFDQEDIAVAGTLTFNGGGLGVGTVTASGIAFDRIIGHDTPFNNESSLTCTACTLSFTTGTLLSETVVVIPLVGTVGFYAFGPSGPASVSMDGEIESDLGGTPDYDGTGVSGNIATGSFTSAFLTVNFTTGGFNFSSINGITDTKVDELVRYYVLGTEGPLDEPIPLLVFSGSTTELGGTGTFGSAPGCLDAADCFSSTSLELADFNNEIPEPGAGFLMLLGVSALMARRRRKG
jgi:hypothetical protein